VASQKFIYRIKGCGCDCANMPADPCIPCGGATVQAQCRSRAGSALLRGYNEFTSPSIPPKKYRKKSFGGSFLIVRFGLPSCTPPETHRCDSTFSGQNTIADNGTETVGGSFTGPIGSGPINGSVAERLCGPFFSGGSDHETVTKTRRSYAPTAGGNGTGCVNFSGISFQNSGNEGYDLLTQEDTEEAAMERAVASWGEWTLVGSNCCAGIEPRGPAEFAFGFAQSEFRLRVSGLPGTIVNLEIKYTRRAFGVGDYVHYYSEYAQQVVPGGGPPGEVAFGEWIEYRVPNESGWQTCFSEVLVKSTS
jgi:hypothetical protein